MKNTIARTVVKQAMREATLEAYKAGYADGAVAMREAILEAGDRAGFSGDMVEGVPLPTPPVGPQ